MQVSGEEVWWEVGTKSVEGPRRVVLVRRNRSLAH